MASLTTCRGTDDDPNPQSPIITNLGVTDFLSTVEAGNYLVADCDRHPFGEGNIVKVLKATQDGVKGALDSPERSIVYQNFFKNADQAVVNAILTNVANGTNMTISDEQRRPTIVCANPHEVESAPHSREACKGNSVAAAVSGHPYVFLCTPSALLSRSPDPNDCVGERPDGHYGTGQKLVQTQTGILLHMLMDMYLSTTSGFGLLEPKAYGLRKVLLLNTTQSLINPSNYVFYVSSKNSQSWI